MGRSLGSTTTTGLSAYIVLTDQANVSDWGRLPASAPHRAGLPGPPPCAGRGRVVSSASRSGRRPGAGGLELAAGVFDGVVGELRAGSLWRGRGSRCEWAAPFSPMRLCVPDLRDCCISSIPGGTSMAVLLFNVAANTELRLSPEAVTCLLVASRHHDLRLLCRPESEPHRGQTRGTLASERGHGRGWSRPARVTPQSASSDLGRPPGRRRAVKSPRRTSGFMQFTRVNYSPHAGLRVLCWPRLSRRESGSSRSRAPSTSRRPKGRRSNA